MTNADTPLIPTPPPKSTVTLMPSPPPCTVSLAEEVWPYISLDNIMDSITLHSSSMFADLLQSLRWSADAVSAHVMLAPDGEYAQLRGGANGEEATGQVGWVVWLLLGTGCLHKIVCNCALEFVCGFAVVCSISVV